MGGPSRRGSTTRAPLTPVPNSTSRDAPHGHTVEEPRTGAPDTGHPAGPAARPVSPECEQDHHDGQGRQQPGQPQADQHIDGRPAATRR